MPKRRGRPPKVAPTETFPPDAVEVETITAPEPVVAQESKAEPVWIFKTHTPHTLIVRGTFNERQVGPAGEIYSVPQKPIKVVFMDSTLTIVVDERLGKQLNQPPEYLAKLMMNNLQCGRSYKLIWGPDFEPDEALLQYSMIADDLAHGGGIGVTQGIRTTGNIRGKAK